MRKKKLRKLGLLKMTFLFCCQGCLAQSADKISAGFERENLVFYRSDKNQSYSIILAPTVVNSRGKLNIKITRDASSTVGEQEYRLYYPEGGTNLFEFSKRASVVLEVFCLPKFQKQVKDQKLILNIEAFSDTVALADSLNMASVKKIQITIRAEEERLASYKYLGYLGTNFDLVDGVQAKNLFFATNIFVAGQRGGFSLGLYGNRSMTKIDSTFQTRFLSKVERLSGDTTAFYTDTALKIVSRVSDNIGAHFTPLFRLFQVHDEASFTVYYAPQFEFIWRRTRVTSSFVNNGTVAVEKLAQVPGAAAPFPYVARMNAKQEFNIYDVYLGLAGALLKCENAEISVRLSSSVGLNYNFLPRDIATDFVSTENLTSTYTRNLRIFYTGRLWVTEPETGLTLGGEIFNYFGSKKVGKVRISKAQPYYNVTLSKAFNLKNLAALIKPLSSR